MTDEPTTKTKGVPPKAWIVTPPFDSADYLDGDPPTYADAEPAKTEKDTDGSD